MKQVIIALLVIVALTSCRRVDEGDSIPAHTYAAAPVEDDPNDNTLHVMHDDLRGVTCYYYWGTNSNSVSISCLPDSQLKTAGVPPSAAPAVEYVEPPTF